MNVSAFAEFSLALAFWYVLDCELAVQHRQLGAAGGAALAPVVSGSLFISGWLGQLRHERANLAADRDGRPVGGPGRSPPSNCPLSVGPDALPDRYRGSLTDGGGAALDGDRDLLDRRDHRRALDAVLPVHRPIYRRTRPHPLGIGSQCHAIQPVAHPRPGRSRLADGKPWRRRLFRAQRCVLCPLHSGGALDSSSAQLHSDPRSIPGSEVAAGLRQIARQPNLRGALLTALATSVLCGPLITFCPVLVRQAFEGNATQFSLTLAGFGVGGLLGAIVLMGVEGKRDRRLLSSGSGACYGLVVMLAARGSVVRGPSCAPRDGRSGDEPQQHLRERGAANGGT